MTTNVTDPPLLMSSDNSRAMIPADAMKPYTVLKPCDALKQAYWACALIDNNWNNGTLVRTILRENDLHSDALMEILNAMNGFIKDLNEIGRDQLLTNVVYALWKNDYEVDLRKVNKAEEIKKAINSSKFEEQMRDDLYTTLATFHVAVTSASDDSKWVDETFSRMKEIHKHVDWNLKVGDGKKHCVVKIVNASPRKFLQELISKACEKKFGVSLKTKRKGQKLTANEDLEERDQSALRWQTKTLFGKTIHYRFTKPVWKNSTEMDILEYRKCLTSLSDLAAKLKLPVAVVVADYRSTEAGIPLTSIAKTNVDELGPLPVPVMVPPPNTNCITTTSNESSTLATSGSSILNATAPITNSPPSNTTLWATSNDSGTLATFPNAQLPAATSGDSGTLAHLLPTTTSDDSGTLATFPNAQLPAATSGDSGTLAHLLPTATSDDSGTLATFPIAQLPAATSDDSGTLAHLLPTATSDESRTLATYDSSIPNDHDRVYKTVSADTDEDATVGNSFVSEALEAVGNTAEIAIDEKTVVVDDNSNRVFPCPNAVKDDHECVHARCSNCHNNILMTAPRTRKRRKAGEVTAVGVCDHTKAHPIYASCWQIVGPTADSKRANGVRLPTKCADCQALFVKK